MRTGILGGTFNPPHLGHLHAAELAHDALRLDRVLFIPTNLPPHKALPENTASPEARCEMVRRLTADRPWAQLDTLEIDRGGASYTVDTLRALHGRGETDLYLIIGTDMLLSFDRSWRAPDEIARLATLAVCARENEDWDALREKAAQLRETLGARIELVHGLLDRAAAGRRSAPLHRACGRGLYRAGAPLRVLGQQKNAVPEIHNSTSTTQKGGQKLCYVTRKCAGISFRGSTATAMSTLSGWNAAQSPWRRNTAATRLLPEPQASFMT